MFKLFWFQRARNILFSHSPWIGTTIKKSTSSLAWSLIRRAMITHSASHIFPCYLLVAFVFFWDLTWGFVYVYPAGDFPSHDFPSSAPKKTPLIPPDKEKHRHMRFEKLDQKHFVFVSLSHSLFHFSLHQIFPYIKISHTNSDASCWYKSKFFNW